MKTVEEIMMAKFDTYKASTKSFQQLAIDGAIEYSNQKLDQAAQQATIKDEDNNDHWYECFPFPEVYKESILSLKDPI